MIEEKKNFGIYKKKMIREENFIRRRVFFGRRAFVYITLPLPKNIE